MKLDPKKTAVLTLDFQNGILGMVTGSDAVLTQAAKAAEFARKKQFKLIHVGLGFDEGHPEVSPSNLRFAPIKAGNLFVKGSQSAAFHESVVKPGETIVYKQRFGAFSENQLHLILRSQGIENLVLFGISTSGITLTTLRQAFDLDYQCVVLKDGCFDRGEEVHRVLTEKVFTMQASVMTVDQFIAEQA